MPVCLAMNDFSIGCLLHNSAATRAGSLDDFFKHLQELNEATGIDSEPVILVDKKSTDNSFSIASRYTKPSRFAFNNFSQAYNLLLESSKTPWILLAQPDMRFNIEEVASILDDPDAMRPYDAVETMQRVHFPDEKPSLNLYFLLVRRDVRFDGFVYEVPRVLPEKIIRFELNAVEHYTRSRIDRESDAKKLFDQEAVSLDARTRSRDPIELYWAAQRFFELGEMQCIDREYGRNTFVRLMQKAVRLKPDFGAAYLELARFQYTMGQTQEAKATARLGLSKVNYPQLRQLLEAVS